LEQLITVDELAGKLKISRVYVYKLVRMKRIPYFHINKAVRFSPSEIQSWLDEKRGQEYHRDRV
jgi:excisionase family DNA binding protein